MCAFELFLLAMCIPVDRKRVVAVSELVDLSFSGDTTPTHTGFYSNGLTSLAARARLAVLLSN